MITNPTATGGGASIEHSFGTRGGSIGTAASDSWRLSPHRTGAVAGHAEVRWDCRVTNQRDEVVMSYRATQILKRKR